MSTYLPFDIQVQIIKRLPIKSLIRFRSLCKAWKSFIDCSKFIAGYSFRQTRSQHLFIWYQVGIWKKHEVNCVSFVDDHGDDDDDAFPNQKFSLTVPFLDHIPTIIGGSHGLFCLTGYFQEPGDSYSTTIAVLWNPAIRKSIAVLVPPNVLGSPFNYVVGFGVCPDTKDPKLVRIMYIDHMKMESISNIPSQVMVFSLSSGEWTTSSCTNLPRKSIEFTSYNTIIGRFIYWLAFDWIGVDGEYRNLIMSFDMSTEEFTEIDLPDSLAEMWEPDFSVYRVRESLAVVEYDGVGNGTYLWKGVCSVWIMENGDSKVFTKLFTINAPNASVLQILGFRKCGEPIVEMQDGDKDYDNPCDLVLYEPFSEHIKDLGIHTWNRCFCFGSSYMESLLLLDHDDGHIIKCGVVKR